MFLNHDKGIKKYKVLQTNDKFLMTFNRKGVPLTSSKILSFGNEKKICFSFAFRSLNCIFVVLQ